jgi:DMSO/TMAO reductase YedYZ heme-binding membrane subunit
MRATGFIALILLTTTVGLGIANLARVAKGPWTRTVAALVHRNVSLLAVVFTVVHILTAISDKYVKVPALSLLVPGLSGYDPFWIGLGAVSIDLLIAVMVTSLLRSHLRKRTWQLVHWLAYLCWPTALAHSIGSGSGTGVDTGKGWSTVIYIVVGSAFAAAVTVRLTRRGRDAVTPLPASARRPAGYAPSATAPTETRPLAAAGTTRPRRNT